MKKILSVLLTIALMLTILPMGLFSITASAETSGDYTYSVYNGQAIIITFPKTYSGALTIPETLGGYPVTSINPSAFENCTGLTSVTIPDSVWYIDSESFKNCTGLTSVTIGDGITTIGYYAFENCTGLTSVTIGDSVKNIYTGAFRNCTGLTNITIPDSVTYINSYAFYNCSGLEKITLPFIGGCYDGTSKTHFGYIFGASSYSENSSYVPKGLKEVIITSSCKTIASNAFYNCSGLTSITIPDSVTSIGGSAFENCSGLTNVYITDIAKWCAMDFGGGSANPLYYADNLYLNNELVTDLVIPDSVTSISPYAFRSFTGLTSINIPNGVTSIDMYSFYNCTGLKSITLPNSITSIDRYAFENCSGLTSITIPDSVTSIGGNAFERCTSLTSITIPDSVTYIGYEAFKNCSGLKKITLPFIGDSSNVTSNTNFGYIFGASTEYYHSSYVPKGLNEVIITSPCKAIASNAFNNCAALTSITIPDSVTSIGSKAFENCTDLTRITIPNSVTNIDKDAFDSDVIFCVYKNSKAEEYAINNGNEIVYIDGTDEDSIVSGKVGKFNWELDKRTGLLKITGSGDLPSFSSGVAPWYEYCDYILSLDLPDTLRRIGSKVFYNCSGITNITIPNGVISIGDSAFKDCTGVTSITIPDSVTSIGEYAFQNCIRLKSLTIPDGVTSIGYDAFYNCSALTKITLPFVGASLDGTSNTHFGYIFGASSYSENSSYIPQGLKEVIITSPCKTIGSNAFYNCKALTSITIPDRVTSIGSSAFKNCSGFTRITIPDSVTSIGDYAFQNCIGLTSITIPDGVTFIGYDAFYDCSGLTSVTIPDSVTSIYSGAFQGCIRLTSITIPDSVTYIGPYAFESCIKLTSITIPDSVTFIGSYAFFYCTKLSSITIPNSVTFIGPYAFYNCLGLTSVTIPNNVTSICESAFTNCSGLTSVTIPRNVKCIEDKAFLNCSSIKDVYYRGSTFEKGEILVGSENEALFNAKWHYICANESDHIYDNACDVECNVCGEIRESCHNFEWVIDIVNNCGQYGVKHEECTVCHVKRNELTTIPATNNHTYTNNCDAVCDVCNLVRIPANHIYDNASDAECNVCKQMRTVTDHIYDNDCDADCNVCGKIRENCHNYEWVIDKKNNCGVVGYKHEECTVCHAKRSENTVIAATGNHIYDNACDAECNVCKQMRNVPDHIYDNDCDADCNVCGKIRENCHNYEWVIDKKNNCGVVGYKHEECTVCHAKRSENTVIAATGNHIYDNACDAECNVCKQMRTVPDHIYDNDCDADCNVCGKTRTITHSYETTTNKATTSKNGSIVKKCSVCGTQASKTTIYYAKKVKLSTTEYTYNGKAKKPSVKLYDSKGNKISSSNYEVSYKNNKKVGKATVTIKFKGEYSGTLKAIFKILPKESKVDKLTAAKKSLKVKLKKVSSQVSGYEIQYSTSSKFKSAKTKKVTSYKTTSVTLKSLKAKKTYYVRVRTYKTVDGKKYYSDWSSEKTKKTK